MSGFSLENQKINKASKWTIFLLVDLRTVFIITYVFITVVNLISATANSEATKYGVPFVPKWYKNTLFINHNHTL